MEGAILMVQYDKSKAMEVLGIDEGILNELLQCYITEAEGEIVKLEEAIRTDNFVRMAEIGHGLKGMSGNLYIYHIQEMAKGLEVLAKDSNKDKAAITQRAADLKQAIEELK